MINLGFKVEGQDQLLDALTELELSFKDFRPLFRDAAKLFYEFEKEAFDTEGESSDAGEWQELSPLYALMKERRHPNKTILRRTDALYRSLTQPNARGSIRRVTETELEIGTSIPYAIYHQVGTSRMPARPLIALTAQQERQMATFLRRGLAEFVRRAGFIVSEFSEVETA